MDVSELENRNDDNPTLRQEVRLVSQGVSFAPVFMRFRGLHVEMTIWSCRSALVRESRHPEEI